MIHDTKKPAAAASKKPKAARNAPAAKPAVKPRATRTSSSATSSPAGKRPVVAAKARATAAAKTVTPVAAAKKSTPVKKAVAKAAPVADKKAGAAKPGKVKKPKLVRDSFTMPEGEYAVIATLKKRCLNSGVPAKKSEILRAAIANLAKLSDTLLLGAIGRLEVIKTGRPAKGSK